MTTSEGYVIGADNVVVCTNTPVNDWLIIHSKQPLSDLRHRSADSERLSSAGLYWDTPHPYHYIRIQQGEDSAGRELDYDILIVGG